MSNETLIRIAVRSLYDLQKLRVATGNRIVASFRSKLGLESNQAEETDEEARKMLVELRSEFKRITDGVKRVTRATKIDSKVITSVAELELLEAYERMCETEKAHAKAIDYEIEKYPIYSQWLKDVRGVGPLMAGVILSEVDIAKCSSVSALWAYAGLDVVLSEKENGEIVGEGRSRKKAHLVPKSYLNREGGTTETVGISFNPFFKTKMVGVLGDVFLRVDGKYKSIYDGYKFRLANHPNHKDKTLAHRHRMAIRYMVKMFLQDLWLEWRRLEGLEVRPPYAEEKLGIMHSK